MKTLLRILMVIIAVPVLLFFLLVGFTVVADWPVNYCKKMTDERNRCLTDPPQFSGEKPAIIQKYTQEFQSVKEPKHDWTVFSDAPLESLKSGFGAGYIDPQSGYQFVISYQGSSTEKGTTNDGGKNLYVRSDAKEPWEQIKIPNDYSVYNAYWINQNGTPKIFAAVYGNPTLFRLKKPIPDYLYDPSIKSWSPLFWGFDQRIAPDHKKMLIKRGYGREFFSYFIWDVNTDKLTPLFMIQEEHFEHQPTKWNVTWSDDSQAIQFVGETKLLGKFNFIYYIPTRKNYKL